MDPCGTPHIMLDISEKEFSRSSKNVVRLNLFNGIIRKANNTKFS